MTRKSIKRIAGVSLAVLVIGMTGAATVQAQSSDSTLAGAMEVRFQQMEKEIRRLTGQIEEQSYEIRNLREELKRVTGDMEVRLNDVESGRSPSGVSMGSEGGATSSYAPQPAEYASPDKVAQQIMDEPIDAPAGVPRDQPPSSFEYTPPASNRTSGQLGTLNQSSTSGEIRGGDSEAVEYETAYGFIKSRDFEQAESAFQAFISKYPNSSYIANAKYWYGETFYVRGNYEKAARIFAESYQADPKGSKAAGNLLKLGMSLAGLDKKEDACVAFAQLQKDYASSAVPLLKRADTEMKRIGCR